MKRIIKRIISIVLCSITIFTLVACGNSIKKEDIVGEWQAVYSSSRFSSVTQKWVEKSYDCTFTINSDHTFSVEAKGQDTVTGRWEIQGDKITFDFGNTTGVSAHYRKDSFYIKITYDSLFTATYFLRYKK